VFTPGGDCRGEQYPKVTKLAPRGQLMFFLKKNWPLALRLISLQYLRMKEMRQRRSEILEKAKGK
jgi:hypothetical protein